MSEHDLFGSISMGYLLIESERMEDWKRFLHKGIGLHLESEGDNLLTFRMDTHRSRIIVRRGPAEDVAAVGWQVEDPSKRQILMQRLLDSMNQMLAWLALPNRWQQPDKM